MYYWFPTVSPYIWIAIFYIFPISFNLFNGQKIGLIGVTLTVIKVLALVGLIVLGSVILVEGFNGPALAGLDAAYIPVPCDQNNSTIGPCILGNGFQCMNFENEADFRLERVNIPICSRYTWSQSDGNRVLGLLRDCVLFLCRNGGDHGHSMGNRVAPLQFAKSFPTNFIPHYPLLRGGYFDPRSYCFGE